MKVWQQRLYDFLKPLGPEGFIGNEEQLAKAAGIPVQSIRRLLNYVRSREFISKYMWTVPYVERGAPSNKYILFDSEYPNRREVYMAHTIRSREVVEQVIRLLAQTALVKSTLSPTSREFIRWNAFESDLIHALNILDLLAADG